MRLHISEIPKEGKAFHITQKTGELNESLSDLLGLEPDYKVDLDVQLNDDLVNIHGHYEAELPYECSRCVESFKKHSKKNFQLSFLLKEEGFKGDLGEIPAEDEGVFDVDMLQGEVIDLGEVVHEQIGLELEFQPLCKEDCKGLCLQCGENLNLATCQCSKDALKEKASPFAVLKGLKLEK